MIYTLRRAADGTCEGPIHQRLHATFASHAALFTWLHAEAVKRGDGTKRTLFLADGVEAIWEQHARWFPAAEPCIDWVHIVERLWAGGRCLHREGSDQLATWVADRVRALRGRSGPDQVITTLTDADAAIAKTGPGNKAKRAKVHMSAAYIKAVTEASPQAQIIFDRFHVQRLARAELPGVAFSASLTSVGEEPETSTTQPGAGSHQVW